VRYYKEVAPATGRLAPAGKAAAAAAGRRKPSAKARALNYLRRLNSGALSRLGAGRDAPQVRLFEWDGVGEQSSFNCISVANIVNVVS
jgi:hypothetical protein